MAQADGRHAVAIREAALFARLKRSAERAQRTVQRQLAVLLEDALAREEVRAGPGAVEARPVAKATEVVPETKAAVSVGRDCLNCGHELRKHEPHCILMGCACRKFR